MKKLTLFVLCLFLFSACAKKEDTTSEHSTPESFEKKTDTTPEPDKSSGEGSTKNVPSKTDLVEIHKFNKNDLPSLIKYRGNILH